MVCPSCAAALLSFGDPCPSCGKRPALATEGALAPDPLARLMPARLESARDIPGRRRKEPSWKEEVRQRVSRRRAQRLGEELPLFPESEPEGALDVDLEMAPPPPPAEPAPAASAAPASRFGSEEGPRLVWSTPDEDVPPPPKTVSIDPAESGAPTRSSRWSLDDDEAGEVPLDAPRVSATESWVFDPSMEEEPTPAAPVERPAQWTDRLQAAAFDLGLLASLWAVVVYFASRAARVSIEGLWASWPFLAGYLAFLGLVYAVYFTGTCGRTVGKIVCGLKVVDVAGRPPGYPRALGRALLGTLGMAFGMIGMLPIFFDPARRALHDRVLRTRVVKY